MNWRTTPAILSLRVSLLLLLSSSPLLATIWHVGSTREYKTPREVVTLVQRGDTVEIDAGEYADPVCVWQRDSLVFRGIGRVVLRLDGSSSEINGTWVIDGNGCTLTNLEFHDAKNANTNGIALVIQRGSTRVVSCAFRKNEVALNVMPQINCSILIMGCEFDGNGTEAGLPVLYVHGIDSLSVLSSYFHGSVGGPEIQSEALHAGIACNRMTNEDGRTGASISFPTGGECMVGGNVIQHGQLASHPESLIQYGENIENFDFPHRLAVVFNTIVNDAGNVTAVASNESADVRVVMTNNLLIGSILAFNGGDVNRDTSNNLQEERIQFAGFVNPTAYDYHLTATSFARGKADPDADFRMTAEYVHPRSFKTRPTTNDVGAFEYTTASSVDVVTASEEAITIAPNPATASITLSLPPSLIGSDVVIMNMQGSEVARYTATHTTQPVDVAPLSSGMYVVRCGTRSALLSIIP
jgi:hypothetical protein